MSDSKDMPELELNIPTNYTTDGLDEKEYLNSDIKQKTKKVTKCHCCHKYYLAESYFHTIKYKLEVSGILTCIHCYFSFNIAKYIDNINLTLNDKECIRYYIEYFTSQHDIKKCDRIKSYNQCLLCNSKKGIKPSYMISDKIVYKRRKTRVTRTGYVAKSNASNFTLSL